MRRLCFVLLFVTVCLSMMIINTRVSATSWAELKPQEVSDRAEVIVIGKYDFSSKPKSSDFIFQGFTFNVKNVYKGDVPKQTIAGIDYNDVGWAEEFQNKGGEFLLFLEKSEEVDFLIPVGGPNGMVQIFNGKVENQNDESRVFYEDFLKAQPKAPSVENSETLNHGQNSRSYILLYVSAGVLIGIVVFILLYRYLKKK
ncbi:MAG TPA: hypothetical protein VEY68_03485 [Anoxybacillus sp.]|nr:hypothetical protein [Anoxybacillus sp.]